MKPLVSVIITNYNYSQFVSEAIESVLNQTYENLELIVVDDGSTDNSAEIISKYQEKNANMQAIFKKNTGQCDSFNEGYLISKGDIIAVLDSDDYYFPWMIERKVEFHENYEIVDSALTIDDKGTPLYKCRQDLNWAEIYREYGYVYCFQNMSGMSFKKSSIDDFLPFPDAESIYGGLDYLLVRAALTNGDVGFDNKFCGFYRYHINHSSNARKSFYEDAVFAENHINGLQEYFENLTFSKLRIIVPNEKDYFQKIVADVMREHDLSKGVLIYGTKASALHLSRIFTEKSIAVKYFTDSNPEVWNKKIANIQVVPLNDVLAKRSEVDIIILGAKQSVLIEPKLIGIGLEKGIDFITLPL